jgi:hypothetical protein
MCGVHQFAERRVVRLHPHDGQVAHGSGLAAGQRAAQRGEREDAGLGFGEHTGAGQRAEQALQRRRVRADLLAQHPDRDRPGHHEVGDAEYGRGVQRLGRNQAG